MVAFYTLPVVMIGGAVGIIVGVKSHGEKMQRKRRRMGIPKT